LLHLNNHVSLCPLKVIIEKHTLSEICK
jgi:hypothetical protein